MHGGDIYNNQVNMDYSVNVNPLGIPDKVKEALTESLDRAGNYPEYGANSLREAIAKKEKCKTHNIVCGNGASELIMAAVNAIRPSKALIPVPAFSGYERALKALKPDCDISYISLSEDDEFRVGSKVIEAIREYEPDLVFVTTPANPVGTLIEEDILQDIVDSSNELGATLIIDECFLSLTGREYNLRLNDRVIILKAFTKSYALAGIRLGYCICQDGQLADRLWSVLPEWNISLPAIAAGKAALKETDYIEESVKLIGEEREYLRAGLIKLGLKVFDSDANYIVFKKDEPSLCKDEEPLDCNPQNAISTSLVKRMLERGILIRDCSDYMGMGRGYYRIAVKAHDDNEKLLDAFRQVLLEDNNE